ncbi:hypothetical protein [Acetivibrio cellulolyticus]|uniref:hypothetical protein n=1 Tax=Acetivibrio cellulolyticus TaxID=35830 RepID=UPI0001E2DE30|nr:hypothetical protein [Acetivibrio cellulolyticus]
MYPDNAMALKASAKKFALYSVMLIVFGVFSFLVFFLPGSLLYNFREYFYFLIFPIIAILAGASVKAYVNSYFVGRWASLAASFIQYFANGLAADLFLAFAYKNMIFLTALVWVFLLVTSIIVFKASKYFYTGIYDGCAIRAFSYILMGLSIKSMFGGMLKEEYFGSRFWTSLTNIVMISFIILALVQMATLVELFYTTKSRRISIWLKRKHHLKFLFISAWVFTLTDLRRGVVGGFGEWMFVFLILLLIFIIFAAKLWGNVKNSPEEKLAKHIQNMNFDKSKDLENVSRYIDEYVNYGKKSKLVSYMTFLGYKTGIPFNAVSNIIAPLVEYSDPEIPGMLTSEQYKAIEERNRQNRSIVIEKITSNLQLFGKGVYGYNGYSTGSNTMQDYN